jgi:DNA-binding response OmpR family regulator
MISRYFKMPEMDRHTLHRPFESAELLLRVRSILSRAAGTC